jgi:hypothetical protein
VGVVQFSGVVAALKKYERHISAVSMIAGFAFDNYFFGRIDHPATQFVLFAYIWGAIGAIVLVHFMETRADPDSWLRKFHPLIVAAPQFAFGGLWSAFLIFYGRSAVFSASWPFLVVMAGIFIGNEVFKKYHSRLVFTCTLLFFALYSYTIFVVPIFTGTMGQRMFLLSGAIATIGFVLVIAALTVIGPQRIMQSWKGIAAGALGVLLLLNASYFTNILPPLPLALSYAGVYHSVTRDGGVYRAVGEARPLLTRISLPGAEPVVHVNPGDSLYLYSAVFAPIKLQTKILHIWQRYDDTANQWRTQAVVSYPITGGREGGYRGFSIKSLPAKGHWRVNIETADGRIVGRVAFAVAPVSRAIASVEQVLK